MYGGLLGDIAVPVLVAGFAVWCVALCWFDVLERRLPNLLTLPAAALTLLVCLWWAAGGEVTLLLGAGLWTAVNGAAFLMRGMGAGDVKLAPTLGGVVAASGGPVAVLLAVLAAQAITIAWAVCVRDRTVPHGPAMCVSALALVLLSVNR